MTLKHIKGFEGLYGASSDDGEIYSYYTDRLLGQHEGTGGYLFVRLYKDGKYYNRRVHRLIAETFLDREDGMVVNHKNSNRRDNRPENLEWVTPSDNVKHSYKEGNKRARRNEDNEQSKLSAQDIRQIRIQLEDGHTQVSVALRWGVDPSLISRIASGKRRIHA